MTIYGLFRELSVPNVGNAETIGVSLASEVICQAGWLMGYEFVRPALTTVGPFTAAFYNPATGLADAGTTVTNINPGTSVGRLQVLLAAPVYYPSEVRRRPTIHHPSGRYAFLNNAFASDGLYPSGTTSGPLFAPPSIATANGNGLYVAGASIAMPVNMFDETLYYVSPLWSDTNPNIRTGTGHITVRTAMSADGRKRGRGSGAIDVATSLASTGHSLRRGTGRIDVVTGLAAAGSKETRGTGSIEVVTSMRGIGRNPDDLATPARVTVGPPGDRWYVGPPT